jgi:hypothetical protein
MMTAGDRLPSSRELAVQFDADQRVVVAAYRELEREGLVEVRARSGMYVAAAAHQAGALLPQLAAWLVEVLLQGRGRGIAPATFPEHARRCLETLRLRAVCLECNADQLANLGSELGEDFGIESDPFVLDAVRDLEALPPELRRADLLVTTTFHAAEVERLARRLNKPWVAIALNPDFITEITRLLEQGPVYFVGTDPRFAEKLRWMFADAVGAGNVRLLIAGHDDLRAVPPGAPLHVMRSARALVREPDVGRPLLPTARVFSEESARQLLTLIVLANMRAMASAAGPGADATTDVTPR